MNRASAGAADARRESLIPCSCIMVRRPDSRSDRARRTARLVRSPQDRIPRSHLIADQKRPCRASLAALLPRRASPRRAMTHPFCTRRLAEMQPSSRYLRTRGTMKGCAPGDHRATARACAARQSFGSMRIWMFPSRISRIASDCVTARRRRPIQRRHPPFRIEFWTAANDRRPTVGVTFSVRSPDLSQCHANRSLDASR